MDALAFLVQHPRRRGPTSGGLHSDEETGRGVEHITAADIGADYGYTVDGEKPGEIEDETFCADSLDIKVSGINVHPAWPRTSWSTPSRWRPDHRQASKDTLSPETTEKRGLRPSPPGRWQRGVGHDQVPHPRLHRSGIETLGEEDRRDRRPRDGPVPGAKCEIKSRNPTAT